MSKIIEKVVVKINEPDLIARLENLRMRGYVYIGCGDNTIIYGRKEMTKCGF